MTQAPVDRSAPVTGGASDGPARRSHRLAATPATTPAGWPWALALAVYSTVVVLVLAWPRPVDDGARDDIGSFFGRLHALGFPTWVDYTLLESGANVAMFVPLGFMIARLRPRTWWWGVLFPVAFSGCAELGQQLLRPDRVATWADVAANSAGAVLGTVAALVVMGRGRSASTPASTRPGRSRHRAG